MNIIDEFVELTEGTDVPVLFRKWIAIGMVAAALGRRTCCVMNAAKGAFYPNFYIVLVGEPGVGKTIALRRAYKIMQMVPNINLGPNKITPQRLLNKLADMSALPENADPEETPRADADIALFIDEFGTLVNKFDPDFMEMMSELWNAPDVYEYSTFKRGDERLYNVCLNLVAGTQPSWFTEGFNPTVMEQGFPARLILVYSDQLKKSDDPFSAEGYTVKKSMQHMAASLEKVTHMAGQWAWNPAAMQYYRALYAEDFAPVPTEPLLRHYSTRRHFHLAKLAVVVAAANHPTKRVITEDDVRMAWELLLEVEKAMPGALVAAGGNKFRPAEKRALVYIADRYVRTGKHVPEALVRRFLAATLTPFEVDQVVSALINMRYVKATGDEPFRSFRPYELRS